MKLSLQNINTVLKVYYYGITCLEMVISNLQCAIELFDELHTFIIYFLRVQRQKKWEMIGFVNWRREGCSEKRREEWFRVLHGRYKCADYQSTQVGYCEVTRPSNIKCVLLNVPPYTIFTNKKTIIYCVLHIIIVIIWNARGS